MSEEQPNNPLHGITLKAILESLVERYGWEGLASRIRVRCFENDPSIASSLVFLRRTPWAREKVERLYLRGDRGRRGFRGPSRRTPASRTSNRVKPDTPRGSDAEQSGIV